MAKRILIPSTDFPYHVTGRVNNREPFPIDLETMWTIFAVELQMIQSLFDVQIHAFVMMPNHFHLLISTPHSDYNLGKVMNYFMSGVTMASHRRTGKTGRLFGSRYHWSIILSSRYYGHVFKYVYRNPVRANLCKNVEEYEFSTVSGLLGQCHLPIPLYFTGFEYNLPDSEDKENWINWLNTPFSKEVEQLIQRCLVKRKIDRILRRPGRYAEPLLEPFL